MAEKKIVRRGSGPFVISGNALRGGHVLWLAEGDSWAPLLEAAAVLETDEAAAAAMGRATADRRELDVVDVHVVDVAAKEGRMVPVTYRERVRAFGPTIATGPDAAREASP